MLSGFPAVDTAFAAAAAGLRAALAPVGIAPDPSVADPLSRNFIETIG